MARGDGLRVRLSRVPGQTPKGVLETPVYLPVVLGEFTLEEDADHRDYTTVRAGEFSVGAPGPRTARRLRTTDLETLTLDWAAPWLIEQGDPEDLRDTLEAILRSRRPVEMLAAVRLGNGRPQEVRMKVTLRSLRRVLKPGEADTRYYSLTTKEWREASVVRRSTGEGRSGSRLPTTHKLKAETTLYGLAKRYYHTEVAWRAIASANGIKNWGPSTPLVKSKRFKVGDKVKIPKKPPIASINPPTRRG